MAIFFTLKRTLPDNSHAALIPFYCRPQPLPCFAIGRDFSHCRYPHEPCLALAIDVLDNPEKLVLKNGGGVRRMEPEVKDSVPLRRFCQEYLRFVQVIIMFGCPQLHALIELVYSAGGQLRVG